MKGKGKTNRLENEADKIEEIPEEVKNGEDKFQEKPSAAKKQKKNRFLACLRKTWARITGCMRSSTSIQVEESYHKVQKPSGTNMVKELSELSTINIEQEFQEPTDIHMKEELDEPSDTDMEEFREPSGINMEDSKDDSSKGKEEEDNGESDIVNITEKREDRRSEESNSNSSSLEETSSNSSSLEETSSNSSSPEETSSNSSQSSSSEDTSDSCSLEEEIPELLSKSSKTSQSSSSDDTSDFCSLEEEIPELLSKSSKTYQSSSGDDTFDSLDSLLEEMANTYKFIKTSQSVGRDDIYDSCSLQKEISEARSKSGNNSQSSSLHDEEPNTSDAYLEEPNQSATEASGTVPLTLNSFCFYKKLGEGTFGKVFMAKDIVRKEQVAIKVSHKQYFLRGHRFVERDILQLAHESPFLIQGLAAFHTQNLAYYVMEFSTGGDLIDFINMTFPLDTATIQFIIAEIICGVQFLHKNGIIHRDLKPENILVTSDGHIKITDFGLSIMGVHEKTNELIRGTPGYAAPEQLKRAEYGHGVDYFAIGAILYILYHFRLPFNDDEDVLNHDARYAKYLTEDTVDILKGLLEKDPLKRLGVNGDIKNHQYFKDINWEDVEARRVTPPAIMTSTCVNLDTSYTLPYAESLSNTRFQHQKMFNEFSFVCAEWSQHYHSAIIET